MIKTKRHTKKKWCFAISMCKATTKYRYRQKKSPIIEILAFINAPFFLEQVGSRYGPVAVLTLNSRLVIYGADFFKCIGQA